MRRATIRAATEPVPPMITVPSGDAVADANATSASDTTSIRHPTPTSRSAVSNTDTTAGSVNLLSPAMPSMQPATAAPGGSASATASATRFAASAGGCEFGLPPPADPARPPAVGVHGERPARRAADVDAHRDVGHVVNPGPGSIVTRSADIAPPHSAQLTVAVVARRSRGAAAASAAPAVGQPVVAPADDRREHREEVLAHLGQRVLVPRRPVLVADAVQQPGAGEPVQPLGQRVPRDAQLGLEPVEPADAVERLTQHEQCPLIPQQVHGSCDGTRPAGERRPSHGRSLGVTPAAITECE